MNIIRFPLQENELSSARPRSYAVSVHSVDDPGVKYPNCGTYSTNLNDTVILTLNCDQSIKFRRLYNIRVLVSDCCFSNEICYLSDATELSLYRTVIIITVFPYHNDFFPYLRRYP